MCSENKGPATFTVSVEFILQKYFLKVLVKLKKKPKVRMKNTLKQMLKINEPNIILDQLKARNKLTLS